MFKIDYDNTNEFELIEKGEYEVVVAQAVENSTPNGAMYLDIQLVVRNDIQQRFQNQRIFHRVFQKKETGEYPMGFINTMAKAFQIPDGKQYSTIDELLNDFKGKAARVEVGHREWNDNKYAEVKKWNITSFPQINHQWNVGDGPMTGFQVTNDENIPF